MMTVSFLRTGYDDVPAQSEGKIKESKLNKRSMFKSIVAVIVGAAVATTGVALDSHPTLPTMWTALVNEDEVGLVEESYIMILKPTPENPSGKWTNFTDGSCQRLIYDGDLPTAARYLLGCDAVDCCIEDQDGNHIEYQIPNVHPAVLAPVTYKGKHKINQYAQGKTTTVVCDAYQWTFGPETMTAYTTKEKNETQLHRWTVSVEGKNFTNDYFNYEGVPESQKAAFQATFNVPAICQPNPLSCGDAYEKGMLSASHLAFVRQEQRRVMAPPTKSVLTHLIKDAQN